MGMIYCRGCGKEIHESAQACPHCGAPQNVAAKASVSNTSKATLAIVCFFLGGLGVHRFMVGKIGTGILMLCTLGAFGIWTLIDFVMILIGKFTDKNGNLITA